MEEVKDLLKKLGYKKEEIEKILSEHAVVTLTPNTLFKKIKENYEFFINQGYSKTDIINMTKTSPAMYSYSIQNLEDKIEELVKLGYDKENIVKITKASPEIYSYSTSKLQQKLEFYNSIGLHNIIIKRPKNLMQSVELSYARYMFYKENGINIDETNFKKLFDSEQRFKTKYKITKSELLSKYDYKKYLEGKNTQELGKETLKELNDIEYINEIEKEIEKQEKNIEKTRE